jgi:non-specific protein-tyrosine kinase
MGIRAFLLVLHERWKLLAAAAVLGAVAAGGVWFLTPPQYKAELQLYASYISPTTGISPDDAYSVLLMSQQRVTSYVQLVTSDRVAREVVRRLGLHETPAEVADQISASNPPQTLIIDVTVEGTSPTQVTAMANTVGAVVHDVVGELDAPTAPDGSGQLTIRAIEPATVPTSPSSIGLHTALALGVLAGLVVGIGGAWLRDTLDTSVKTPGQLRAAAAGAPTLGTISFDRGAAGRPLAVYEDARSQYAEDFLRLRTNVRFADGDAGPRAIMVASALPDEGKTTTLCNLAAALALLERRVVVVEADLRRPGVAGLLGVTPDTGLTDVIAGRMAIDDALQTWKGGAVDVLASGPLPLHPSEVLCSKPMLELLSRLRDSYDCVLIDTPAVLPVADAAALAPSTDGALLVCRYRHTTAAQVSSAVDALHAVSTPVIGTVLTMVPRRGPHAYGPVDADQGPGGKHRRETEPPSSPPGPEALLGVSESRPG